MSSIKRRELKCGNLTAIFEDGGLRYIKVGDVEVIRGIYAAVRDRNWGTVLPDITQLVWDKHESGCRITFQSAHKNKEIDFVWEGCIEVTVNSVRFTFEGMARSAFLKNRIGFCLLHPMHFAGMKVEVQTPSGLKVESFPKNISPHQPIKEINGLDYEPVPGLRAMVRFDGDLFEMEDQRNWTDASYKTYCTPLETPFPVQVREGQRIRQTITVDLETDRFQINEKMREQTTVITFNRDRKCALPAIGTTYSSDSSPTALDLLSKLDLSHLHVVLDLVESDWHMTLTVATKQALQLRCELELELIVNTKGDGLRELLEVIRDSGSPVARILIFADSGLVTTKLILQCLKAELQEFALNIQAGGGTRGYFAQFNRTQLPAAEMDIASYTINPQVHAFDDRSLMETLAAQQVTVTNAVRITSGKPLCIGPITLRPRLNPDATGRGEIRPEDQFDPRLRERFGAAWLLGSLSALAVEGVCSLTYFETAGLLGLISEEGQVYPLYHAMADVLTFEGDSVCISESSSPEEVAVLALSRGDQVRVFAVNITPDHRHVRILDGQEEHIFELEPYAYICQNL